jgi:hypothetical protein
MHFLRPIVPRWARGYYELLASVMKSPRNPGEKNIFSGSFCPGPRRTLTELGYNCTREAPLGRVSGARE